MALTADEKVKIVGMVGIPLSILTARITSLGADHITAVEEAIRVELERWETAGFKYVSVEPTSTNMGVRIDPDRAKNAIIQAIAHYLELPQVSTAAMGTLAT
jgi:hypothetical protein